MTGPRDLAAMLVETEATLFAAFDQRASVVAQIEALNGRGGFVTVEHLKATRDSARESAATEARRIVAQVFGPACDAPHRWKMRPTPAGFMGPPVHDSVPAPEGPPAETCSRCLWPRSEHRAPSETLRRPS